MDTVLLSAVKLLGSANKVLVQSAVAMQAATQL